MWIDSNLIQAAIEEAHGFDRHLQKLVYVGKVHIRNEVCTSYEPRLQVLKDGEDLASYGLTEANIQKGSQLRCQ